MTRSPRLLVVAGLLLAAVSLLVSSVRTASTALAYSAASHPDGKPAVVLISIDGFRWDYLDKYPAPTLSAMAAGGIRSDGLIPQFPSKTFPNHYTLVTGLRPARHGITSNNMVDPTLPGRFTLGNRSVQQDTRWWGGEPLWITAERQGQVAATMFWPGSDVVIAGRRPTHWRRFRESLPDHRRVDQLLTWFDQPASRRPTFLTLYFNTVDDAGHDAGPDAETTRRAVAEVDRSLARLVDGVARLGLTPHVNYILVSDHGMAALSRDRVIVTDDVVDSAAIDVIDTSPVFGVSPRRGQTADDIAQRLQNAHPRWQVYTRDTLPERLGLRGHPRLPPVVAIADDGWHVTSRLRRAGEMIIGRVPGGNHGYDPSHESMHGLFVASGPLFQQGVRVPRVENIHVYELICRVLGLTPAPNDGDARVTAGFLR